MSRQHRISWVRHGAALLVLWLLDLHGRLRRLVSQTFWRTTVVLFALLFLAMVASSLLALWQITRSVQSLIGDAMVGLESSVAMRSAVRETQLDLLRLKLESERRLSSGEVEALRLDLARLLQTYRTEVFEPEDEANAQFIERKLEGYLATLRPLVDNPRPETETIKVADTAARELVEAVERAYQFNRARIHQSAEEARTSAERAIHVSKLLWLSLALFVSAVALVYLVYRWLTLPEEGNA